MPRFGSNIVKKDFWGSVGRYVVEHGMARRMKAIRVKVNRESANVDVQKCLSCGVCVPTCPVEAVELVERDEYIELPDGMTFVRELLEDNGGDPSGLFG